MRGNFHRAFDHLNRRARVVHSNAERGAFYDGGKKRCLHAEMRVGHFLDAVNDIADFFQKLRQPSARRRIGHLQARARRDHRIFLAPDQNRACVGAGRDHVAAFGLAAPRSRSQDTGVIDHDAP